MIKKVLIIKNLPSNILEEATFVLKDGINIDEDVSENLFKSNSIVIEAENILDEYINKYENIEIKKESFLNKILNIIKKV